MSRASAFLDQAHEWSEVYDVVVPSWTDDARVLVVSYEALVRDPEQELIAICDFLGENYDPQRTTGRTDETVFQADGMEPAKSVWRRGHHERSLAPVSTDSLERWRQELSPDEVAFVEGVCRSGMRCWGYRPSRPALARGLGVTTATSLPVAVRAETAVLAGARRVRQVIRDRRTRSGSS